MSLTKTVDVVRAGLNEIIRLERNRSTLTTTRALDLLSALREAEIVIHELRKHNVYKLKDSLETVLRCMDFLIWYNTLHELANTTDSVDNDDERS